MESREFEKLIEVVDRLLSKDGCSWDRSQNLKSLRGFVLEEALELIDALDKRDIESVIEELGDIMYHIIFIARLTRKEDALSDAIKSIREKLIYRHPHIFHRREKKNTKEVVLDWERIKIKEKNANSIGYGLIHSFPALLSSYKLGARSESYNFDWDSVEPIFKKLYEEVNELKAELKKRRKNRQAIEYEIGDILFVVSNIARHLNVNPEIALMKTNKKFIKRFDKMCSLIRWDKKDISRLSIDEMESYWQRAKRLIRN